MRLFLTIYVLVIVATVSILGFRGSLTEKEPVEVFNDMDRQAKYKPQAENSFYANGQNDRLPPKLTVSRGNALEIKDVFYLTVDQFADCLSRLVWPPSMSFEGESVC